MRIRSRRYNRRAAALRAAGKAEEAIRVLEKCLVDDPNNTDVLESWAQALEDRGQPKEAAAAWERLSEARGGDTAALARAGFLLLAAGSWDRCETLLSRASRDIGEIHLGVVRCQATALAQLGRWEEAADAYRLWSVLDPEDAEPTKNGAEVLERLERWEEAAVEWERLSMLRGGDQEALLRAGELWSRLERRDRAGDLYREILALDPNHGESAVLLVEALARSRRWEEVAQIAEDDATGAMNDPRSLVYVGMAMKELSRFAEADSLLHRASFLSPTDVMPLWLRSEVLSRAGRIDEAEPVNRRLVSLEPENPDAWTSLGLVQANLGSFADAARALRQAVRIDPGNDDRRRELGRVLLAADRFEEAIGVLARLLQSRPEDRVAVSQLALALSRLGRWEEAAAVHRIYLERTPEDLEALDSLAGALFNAGLWDDAAEAYAGLADLQPDDSTHLNLGVCLSRAGRWEEAAASFRRVFDADAENTGALYHLGVCLLETGRWEQAEIASRQLIEKAPDNPLAFLNLGRALESLERWEGALGAYRRCIAMDPGVDEAHGRLADVLARLGRASEGADLGDGLPIPAAEVHDSLANPGPQVRALEGWIDDLVAVPSGTRDGSGATARRSAGAERREDARLLFVLDNDYGELTTVMYLALGQDLRSRATLLLPDRLYATNWDVIPGRTQSYSSFTDVCEQVESDKPDLVFLCSGYLLTIHEIFSLQTLARLVEWLQDRGCTVVTSDPFLGLLPGRDVTELVSIDIPDHAATQELLRRKEEGDRRLHRHFSESAQILGHLPHLLPACSPDGAGEGEGKVNLHSFFNPELLCPSESVLETSVRSSEPDSGRPIWLFILAASDLEAQRMMRPPQALNSLLVRKLNRARELGRRPVLIAPNDLVKDLTGLLPAGSDIDLLTFCPFRHLVPLLLAAEYAFYWNVVSHSILIRLFNQKPVFLYDRGHLVRNVTSLYPRIVSCYYQSWEPVFLTFEEDHSLAQLQELERRYRTAARGIREGFERAPTPQALIERLRVG